MPKKIVIAEEEFFIYEKDPKRIYKQPLASSQEPTLVYVRENGDFKDLIYRNKMIQALTEDGYFFSTNKGKTWLSYPDWEDEHCDYQWQVEFNKPHDFLRDDRPQFSKKVNTASSFLAAESHASTSKDLEFCLLTDESSKDKFFKILLQLSLSLNHSVCIFYSATYKEEIRAVMRSAFFKNHPANNNERTIENTDHLFFIPTDNVLEVYHLHLTLEIMISAFDIKTILIPNFKDLIPSTAREDYAEACRVILERVIERGVRVVVG